jgi:hypothetical protein
MIGRCFYYDTPPNERHLFVVLAPIPEDGNKFICVNITTRRIGSDTTCELAAGEHPELTNPISIALYGGARELPRALILRLTGEQRIQNMPPEVLLRIQTAPLAPTSRLKNKYRDAIAHYLEERNQQG